MILRGLANALEEAVTSVAPECYLALRKQFSVLSCHPSVKSQFWPDNELTTEPTEILVALPFNSCNRTGT